jgi:Ni2+-binding GTPase involved in maturation of urease and hydrogenase
LLPLITNKAFNDGFQQFLDSVKGESMESEANSKWEKGFRNCYYNNLKCVILLISPPGAGKTHLLESIEDDESKQGRKVVKIDCSNDQLVETV